MRTLITLRKFFKTGSGSILSRIVEKFIDIINFVTNSCRNLLRRYRNFVLGRKLIAATMSESNADFHSAVLGTQQYWDDAYSRELKTYEDIGDAGEIWFGEGVQDRIIRWITTKSHLPPTSRVLDIGCGNGALLLALRKEGFTDLTGIDYSEGAVLLSRSIAENEDVTDIKFETSDILLPKSVVNLCKCGHFDVCLDKGTYDAICLRDANVLHDRIAYRENVCSLLCDQGLFIMTSCNWTREQLEQHFSNDFELVCEIPAPKYTFGGKTGQTVTTIVFKRKLASGS